MSETDEPKHSAIEPPAIEPDLFRRVMGQFATGVTVITTRTADGMRGMTANAFMSGSLDPPLCVVSVGKQARMHRALRDEGRFVVNILARDQAALASHFAGAPGEPPRFEIDRIDDLPCLKQAMAHLAARVVAGHDCGDHTLFVGHLFHMDAARGREPLLYHSGRFGALRRTRDDREVPAPEYQ